MENKETITERVYRNIIAGDSVKKQALITAEFNLLASLAFWIYDFPFPKMLAVIAFVSSMVYFAFYFLYDKIKQKEYIKTTSLMSFMAFVFLALVIHLSGGIVSPFLFLYFCVYVFENMGGIRSKYSLYFGIISYVLVVLLEYAGIIPVYSPSAYVIYKSHLTTFILTVSTVSFMATVSYSSQIIYDNMKNKLALDAKEREDLIAKYAELDKKANIGGISHKVIHDMRTPLTLIKNYLLMSRKYREIWDDEQKFKAVDKSIDGLSESMEAIIAYGRKNFDYQTRRSDICEVMDNTIKVLKFYSGNSIEYKGNYAQVKGRLAYFNENELYAAFFNLLKNAVDSFKDCDVKNKFIEVNCLEREDFFEVEIFNNGPVFKSENLAKAFKESFTTKEDGSGLGLMIVRDAVDQNDSAIKVENKGEKYGVLFTIKIKKIK